MKNLKGAKVLDTKKQKNIQGGWVLYPGDHWGDECPWNHCMNSFGRCSFIACLP